jgi:hypothetical protein
MCDFVKLYYAVFTKGFNLILEYNHVTILSKYLFSLTRERKNQAAFELSLVLLVVHQTQHYIHDCKK